MKTDNKVQSDKINEELSQTFFGTVKKTVSQVAPSPVRDEKNKQTSTEKFSAPQKTGNPEVKKKIFGRMFFLLTCLAIIAAGLLTFNFFRHKRISVAFDMDIKPSDDMRPSISRLSHKEKGIIYKTFIPKPTMKTYMQEALDTRPKNPRGEILFDFEKGTEGWEIPSWAWEKNDHVARTLKHVNTISSTGSGSLEMFAEFPGKKWTGAMLEMQQYLDLSEYQKISIDVFIPSDAPQGLKGKIILTVGDKWRFVEMSRNFNLIPGRWTTIFADISDDSKDWKRTVVDEDFRGDIRKLAVRVESNRKPAYTGPVYIDSFRTAK